MTGGRCRCGRVIHDLPRPQHREPPQHFTFTYVVIFEQSECDKCSDIDAFSTHLGHAFQLLDGCTLAQQHRELFLHEHELLIAHRL